MIIILHCVRIFFFFVLSLLEISQDSSRFHVHEIQDNWIRPHWNPLENWTKRWAFHSLFLYFLGEPVGGEGMEFALSSVGSVKFASKLISPSDFLLTLWKIKYFDLIMRKKKKQKKGRTNSNTNLYND